MRRVIPLLLFVVVLVVGLLWLGGGGRDAAVDTGAEGQLPHANAADESAALVPGHRRPLRPSREFGNYEDTEANGSDSEPGWSPYEDAVNRAMEGQTDIHEERSALLEAVASSGASEAAWTQVARAQIDEFVKQIDQLQPGTTQIDRVSCYASGCVLDMSFQTSEAHRNAQAESDRFFAGKWRNMRVFTGAEPAGDHYVASLVLVAPYGAGDAPIKR